jgi:DNA polymerase-1
VDTHSERSLYLLDGSSLLFRAFFALPPDLATGDGLVTNAVHGFVNMLVSLLRDQDPAGIAVAWDRSEPTFRDEILEDYKGTRPPTPELLSPQFPLVRRVLDALGICSIDAVGYEADDVLATLATWARDAKRPVVVVTGDRDSFQLVEDPFVRVLYTRKGLSDTVLYDEAGIEGRTGVRPVDYPLLAALRGDPSDNLPGVPGVGEKTAAKLVVAYKDLDTLYAHVAEQTPKLRDNLIASERQVRQNTQVIPLVRDIPLGITLDDLVIGGWDVEATRKVFADLELRSAWRRLDPFLGEKGRSVGTTRPGEDPEQGPGAVLDVSAVHVTAITDSAACVAAFEALGSVHRVAIWLAWEGDPGRSPVQGMAVVSMDPPGSVPVWFDGALLEDPAVSSAAARLFGQPEVGVVAHQAKEAMRSLLPLGIDIVALDTDTVVVGYLLDPAAGQYRLEELADRLLELTIEGENTARPAGELDLAAPRTVSSDTDMPSRAGRRVVALAAVAPRLRASLTEAGMEWLYQEVERPLVRVLARMEVAGIGVDASELRRLAADLTAEAQRLESKIHELAGETFNVNSTPQLRAVLYERLGLTPGRKTKTGYSTDAATLERLRGQHPVVDTLLAYREVEKLRSTYGESLLAEVGPDGRIHATFQQTVARTGRLSSDRPNLHNIPVRTSEGRKLRRAFVPAAGCRFLVADYDQIELRVIAHLSGDPGLVEAFAAGQDIHRATAARVFGVSPETVTAAQRNRAKMVSYGLAYGMEAFGLSQRLGIEVSEAASILDAFFAGFPGVRSYMEETVATARNRGYTETLLGRRRPLPDLVSPNQHLRQAAERQAMNSGIQGLAADLFKVALVRLDDALCTEGLMSRVVLQVHDEVILEVPEDEEHVAGELVPRVLRGVGDVVGMVVPLEVSRAWGSSWAAAKDG